MTDGDVQKPEEPDAFRNALTCFDMGLELLDLFPFRHRSFFSCGRALRCTVPTWTRTPSARSWSWSAGTPSLEPHTDRRGRATKDISRRGWVVWEKKETHTHTDRLGTEVSRQCHASWAACMNKPFATPRYFNKYTSRLFKFHVTL